MALEETITQLLRFPCWKKKKAQQRSEGFTPLVGSFSIALMHATAGTATLLLALHL